MLYGYPDTTMIGEYLWFDNDHKSDELGAKILAVSNRVADSEPPKWNVDVYQLLTSSPYAQEYQASVLIDLTEEEVKSLTFKAGSFIGISESNAFQLRICPYL